MENGGSLMPYSFLHLDQVDSTNAFLLRQQQEGTAICGCVVSANEQTAGKGMGANQWESEPGMNLTFSMAVDMSFMKAADQFLLSQAVPLGLLDVLDPMLLDRMRDPSLTVKWPNDLFFGDRKLCGILINSTIRGMDMGTSVIGIGLNVNQMQFRDWPTYPISLRMILGREMALKPLLEQLVEAVGRRIQLLRSPEGVAEIKKEYLDRLYRYCVWADYEIDGLRVRRFITGIDGFGRLETMDESGEKYVYDMKEIKFV